MRDPDLDPLPVQGDVTGGMSDKAILIISTIGFALLGSAMYMILSSMNSEDEEDDHGEQQRNWDDELDEADVRTLNRAQRRARAKNRMKRNRRVAPLAQPRRDGEGEDGGDGDGQQQQQQLMLEADHGSDGEEEEGSAQPVQQHLSRKERTRLAKQAEREERRLYEEERREARREAEEKATSERRQRERDARVAAEEEMRREAMEAEERERAEHEEWTMMFVKSRDADAVTVRDFVDYVKRCKVVAIDHVAARFRVSTKDVIERLRQLEKEGRINGIMNDRGDYLYLSPDNMRAIADFVKQKGTVTFSELAEEGSRLLLREIGSQDIDE